MHINNIFSENESDEISTCKDFLTVQNEGKREVKIYEQEILAAYLGFQLPEVPDGKIPELDLDN